MNETGFEQARRVAERLATESVQCLVSSDLLRARQTAHPPSLRLGLEPVTDSALREQAFGVVDGMRSEDIEQGFPQEWERWLRFDGDFAFAGGESTRLFHARVMGALQRLSHARAGQRIVVVTHGGVLDMVYRSAMGLPLSGPRHGAIPNGGISRVRLRGDAVEIVSWAETAHLHGLPAQPVYEQRSQPSTSSPSLA